MLKMDIVSIQNRIDETKNKIKELEAQIELLKQKNHSNYENWVNGDRDPEKRKQMKEQNKKNRVIIDGLGQQIEVFKIVLTIENGNKLKAISDAINNNVETVLKKYKGKKLGPVTTKKINDELKKVTGYYCWFDEYSLSVNISDYGYYSHESVVFYFEKFGSIATGGNERINFIDENNKLNMFDVLKSNCDRYNYCYKPKKIVELALESKKQIEKDFDLIQQKIKAFNKDFDFLERITATVSGLDNFRYLY